jgi:hypothetical protein
MNDDRIDELMAEVVRGYNAPGAVPRDEMWARIQAARREQRSTHDAPISRKRWFWPGIGVAAAAVLALGIALGRRMERIDRTPAVAPRQVAANQTPAPRPDTAATRPPATRSVETAPDSVLEHIHEETRATGRRASELALAPRAQADSSDAGGRTREESTALAYRLVMLQHIAGSEAMITAFRTSARRGDVDAQTAQWARELLGTTRLLESSPAANDPTMRRLLQDLDLVIAQIVQYASHGTTNPEELDLIEHSIQKRGLMMKLRSTTPSRALTAGT